VGAAGNSLRYRGYAVDELAEKASSTKWPHGAQGPFAQHQMNWPPIQQRLKSMRGLPDRSRMSSSASRLAHPMDVLRTGCSFLGNLEPETDFDSSAGRSRSPAGQLSRR
jgi:2-methylcitrate synthase